jgi:hypothetical protein
VYDTTLTEPRAETWAGADRSSRGKKLLVVVVVVVVWEKQEEG